MKLILINGPAGVGKSTLASEVHTALPLSLYLEVDAWRRFISAYKQHREESLALVYTLSLAAIEAYLSAGHDVIIDKMVLESNAHLDTFLDVGRRHGAEVYELMLTASKKTVLARVASRGLAPDSLLTLDGAERFYDEAERLRETRVNAIVIETEGLSPHQVFVKAAGHLGISI